MNRQNALESVTFLVLVTAGVATRIAFEHVPNFAPVAAIALFAGFFFRSWTVALCVPLSVMAISDWFIGGYHPAIMVCVYGMLALPVAMRGFLRSRLPLHAGKSQSSFVAAGGLVGCSLLSSLLFFVVTNFATWLFFSLYPHSVSGLVSCYVQALPFFRYTLLGDMTFAAVLFGGYAMAVQILAAPKRAEVFVRG